jgi:homoaconitase/3-isopropylmalate dehydratase large subunit
MGMTMTQKNLARHAGRTSVAAGELIEANLDLVMGNDVTAPPAIDIFNKMVRMRFLIRARSAGTGSLYTEQRHQVRPELQADAAFRAGTRPGKLL